MTDIELAAKLPAATSAVAPATPATPVAPSARDGLARAALRVIGLFVAMLAAVLGLAWLADDGAADTATTPNCQPGSLAPTP
jgi:ferric-dicitrate binding protein FerR (iron transport regulator)